MIGENKISYYHYLLAKSKAGYLSLFDMSIYVKLKAYKNSTLYNYNTRTAARLWDIPVSRLNIAVKRLIRRKYLRLHHGNLTAVAKNKILKRNLGYIPKKGWLPIDVSDIRLIEIQLQYHILRDHSLQQQYRIDKKKKEIAKTGSNSNPGDPATKEAIASLTRNFFDKAIISARSAARLLNMSHTKANNIINSMVRLGMVKRNRIKEVLNNGHRYGKGITIETDEKVYIYAVGTHIIADHGSHLSFLSCLPDTRFKGVRVSLR